MWEHLEHHSICVELSENTETVPINALAVDIFLDEMISSRYAPEFVFDPPMLGDHLWTKSVTTYIYTGIENAFTRAARMPGGNRPGYLRELKQLKALVEAQKAEPTRQLPDHFATTTALFFANGILDERRSQRIQLLKRLERDSPPSNADLIQLSEWVEDDLTDARLTIKGRPAVYQRIIFASEIANLWNTLTNEPISRSPGSFFARFVVSCWESGFPDATVKPKFDSVIRKHIIEDPNPKACGRCECCKKSEKCERKRYLGTLN